MGIHVTPPCNLGLATKVLDIHRDLEALRKRKEGGMDISMADFISSKFSHDDGTPVTWNEFLHECGIEMNRMTVENLITAPYDVRYLVPEIIRESIRLGLRRAPIHPNIIRGSETVETPSQVMPAINFSTDADMEDIGEGESIPVGEVSWTSKTVSIAKKARGIQFTYESIQFTTLNLIGIFFEDVGVRLGHTIDAMAINTIINGDVTGGSYAAPVIGCESTSNKVTYYDLTRAWVHGSLIGRSWSTMIGNEAQILKIMNWSEYKDRQSSYAPKLDGAKIHIPIVTAPDIWCHINIPDDQVIMQDNAFGLVQLTAIPLMVESEKIVNRQVEGTYASLMTGFAKLFRDSSLILDGDLAFSGNSWPSWMTPTGFTS